MAEGDGDLHSLDPPSPGIRAAGLTGDPWTVPGCGLFPITDFNTLPSRENEQVAGDFDKLSQRTCTPVKARLGFCRITQLDLEVFCQLR